MMRRAPLNLELGEPIVTIDVDEVTVPTDADRYCHIEYTNGKTYCGYLPAKTGPTCALYDGEAICPSCGLPTCPTCAVQSDLNARLP
jgi:hypothetical protein